MSGSVPVRELRRRATAMARILHHRGPDGHGVWTDPQVVLAHTRLAIIDTSASANQPMHDSTDTIHIVFNGEIYNFMDLRAQLQAAGHHFRTRGDTEVLVEGYREWGTDLFGKLVGMFALAVWDSRQKRLVMARDRFGEKPLYYADRPDAFVFGSEIKALLTWPGMPRRPDFAGLHDFLTFGYTLAPGTAFAGISHCSQRISSSTDAGKQPESIATGRCRCRATARPSARRRIFSTELIRRLRAAVKACLVSDVPLGLPCRGRRLQCRRRPDVGRPRRRHQTFSSGRLRRLRRDAMRRWWRNAIGPSTASSASIATCSPPWAISRGTTANRSAIRRRW